MNLRIKKVKSETKDIFSLILQKPEGFSFYPGQYLDIKLPVQDPNGDTRAFTISSSPTEDFLMITPKMGLSLFKKFMAKLTTHDEIEATHPAGTFTLDESSPAVFIAGGVGITPFRSMIKYVVDQKLKTPIALIYSNSGENFPFKDELNQFQKLLPNLKIAYHNSTQSGRLALDSKHLTLDSIFYLAGSHSFVNSMEKILLEMKVDQTNIRYDRFDGF